MHASPRSKLVKFVKVRKKWVVAASKVLLVVLAIPGILALIGFIVEASIYLPSRRPNFHVLYFAVAGWIAAPLILVRWFWCWPRHLSKLEFVFYVAQTTALFVTMNTVSLTGNDVYQTNAFLRREFRSGQFANISRPEDVWRWLHTVLTYVYDRDDEFTAFNRLLSGRVAMGTAMRLRQNRVRPRNCSAFYTRIQFAGSKECYPPFNSDTEERAAYGKLPHLQFIYSNNTVNSTSGHPISMEDYKLPGEFGSYPVAGYWTFFSPSLDYNTSLSMLGWMQDSVWIDHQTRAIGLDVAIILLDFDPPLYANLNFMVEVNTAGSFVPLQPQVDINFFSQYEHDGLNPESFYDEYYRALLANLNLNALEECPVNTLRTLLLPFYLGIMPFLVLIVANAIIDCTSDWRQYVKRPFNIVDMVYVIVATSGIALQIESILYVDCGSSVFEQATFDKLTPGKDFWETLAMRYAVRFEVLQLASVGTNARRILGIAIFLNFFTFLKFLLKLKALGVLVRTLRCAAVDLLSFSFSFLVLFAGFVVMFYFIYSIEASNFRTVALTVASLWLGMLGELEVTPELWRGGYLTLGLFIIFTFLSAFVLLTTIVSIISTAYEGTHKYDAVHRAADKKAAGGHPDGAATAAATAVVSDEEMDDIGDNGAAEADDYDDDTRLISEGEMMLTTLKTWRNSMIMQRRSRKIGSVDGMPEVLRGGSGDCISQCSAATTATMATTGTAAVNMAIGRDVSPTASTANLIPSELSPSASATDLVPREPTPQTTANQSSSRMRLPPLDTRTKSAINGGWTDVKRRVTSSRSNSDVMRLSSTPTEADTHV